jgi:hypothetical protein
MSIFKKFVLVAVFLCAATVAEAEEGMRIGIRFGYSMQSVIANMGMLGLRAGIEADIPIGPIFISPEVDFLYRNNWTANAVENGKAVDWTQPEYAVSIPIMIKFILGSTSFIAIGAQVDIPIAAEECFGDNCVSMDGKKSSYERANFDVGIVLGSGYIITPSLALDIRYVYGITPHHKYEYNGILGNKSNPMSSYGFGITYFFL